MNADEQRARELLAAEYERVGWAGTAIAIRKGRDDVLNNGEHAAIRAIMAALYATPQAPQPVVDECPDCHRAWTEHRMGYSASSCKQKQPAATQPQQPQPEADGDVARVSNCPWSEASEHVAFIEACADMLDKFNRPFTARTLRGTAAWFAAYSANTGGVQQGVVDEGDTTAEHADWSQAKRGALNTTAGQQAVTDALTGAVIYAHGEFEDKEHVARTRGDIGLADYYGKCKAKMAAALAADAGEVGRG